MVQKLLKILNKLNEKEEKKKLEDKIKQFQNSL